MKSSLSSSRNWNRRFLILRSCSLCYYEDEPEFVLSSNEKKIESNKSPKGELEIGKDSVVSADGVDITHGFKIKLVNTRADDEFIFAVPSDQLRNEWLDALSNVITFCTKNLLRLYVSKYNLSETSFLNHSINLQR